MAPSRKTNPFPTIKTPKCSKTCRGTATTSKKFHHFLDLPPELRARILKLAVKSTSPIEIRRHHQDKDFKPRAETKYALRKFHEDNYAKLNRSTFAIALTSRRVYLEAVGYYYVLNTFRLTLDQGPRTEDDGLDNNNYNDLRLQQFVKDIGPTNAASITNFAFTYDYWNCSRIIQLAGLPFSLKILDVEVISHSHFIPPELEEYVKDKKDLTVRLSSRFCCTYWENVQDQFLAKLNGGQRLRVERT